MNTLLPLDDTTIHALAVTLGHFTWQAALVGAVVWSILFVAAPRSAQLRYAICACAMLGFVILPVVTFVGVPPQTSVADAVIVARSPTQSVSTKSLNGSALPGEPSGDSGSFTSLVKVWAHRGQPYLVAFWLFGSLLTGVRLLVGAVGVWRLARTREPLPAPMVEIVDRLSKRMAFRVRPAVYCSRRVTQAVAIGVLRPMVLLPTAWVLELPPSMVQAVLAHELAHLRRWDLPLNLLQRLVEAVFFFHPAVWWCSRRMRIEREICCDEVALAATGNRVEYAETLTFLATHSDLYDTLLVAGIGGSKMSLLERVRHVLGKSNRSQSQFYGPVCAVVGAAAASLAWGLVLYAASEPKETAGVAPAVAPSGVGFGWAGDDPPGKKSTGRRPWSSTQPVELGVKGALQSLPSEKDMVTLPDYTIEPPDILFIEASRVVPKAPYHIQSTDTLTIQLTGGLPGGSGGGGPSGDQYQVSPSGKIDLGPAYEEAGRVKVAGLTDDEAAQAIESSLRQIVKNPQVSVQLSQTSSMQPIAGEHLVAPDGTVNLGSYGRVYVAGMTLDEARDAIKTQLSETLDDPVIFLSMFAYNSKVFYVIVEDEVAGDMVSRFPVTGNETVLDALSVTNGLSRLQHKYIWIARPEPGSSGRDAIIPVNWKQITFGAATANNYQVLPGDRIFVSNTAPPSAR